MASTSGVNTKKALDESVWDDSVSTVSFFYDQVCLVTLNNNFP